MKIRVTAEPGELEAKAEDVVRVLEKLIGRPLSKAMPPAPNDQIKQTPAKFEYAPIKTSVTHSRKDVRRILDVLNTKINTIIG